MKLLLAVSASSSTNSKVDVIEQHIIDTYKDIKVCAIVRNKKDLIERVTRYSPDVVLLSAALPGNENIIELLVKLTSDKYKNMRIAFLYGEDDEDSNQYINLFHKRGIYDYYIGKKVDSDVIRELIFNPKNPNLIQEPIDSVVLNHDSIEASVPVSEPVKAQSVKHTVQDLKDAIYKIKGITEDNIASDVNVTEKISNVELVKKLMTVLTDEEKRDIGLLKDDVQNVSSDYSSEKKDKIDIVKEFVKDLTDAERKNLGLLKEVKQEVPVSDFTVEKIDIQCMRDYIKELPEDVKRELGLIQQEIIKEEIIKEQIILRDMVVGRIIAVGGTGSRCGCTHTALHIAYYLSKHVNKYSVAVVQLNDKNDFQDLGSFTVAKNHTDKSFSYKKIDFYYESNLLELKSLNKYNYIVLDLGSVKNVFPDGTISLHKNFDYMKWADISILVCNSKPWHLKELTYSLFDVDNISIDYRKLYNNETDKLTSKKWNLLFNMADDDFYESFASFLGKSWKIFKCTYSPNLFKTYQDLYNTFDIILNPILPVKDKVISSKKGIFKKKVSIDE